MSLIRKGTIAWFATGLEHSAEQGVHGGIFKKRPVVYLADLRMK
jgi:hypothetical protein